MRFGLELHVVTALDKSAHCRCFPLRRRNDRGKAREKLRKLRQTKMEANYEAEQNLTKKALLLTNEAHLAYGLIADQISAPVLSAPTDLLREQIRWSTAPTVLGQTEPAEPPNRTPDPAAPSDLVLLLGTNRMNPAKGRNSTSILHVPLSLLARLNVAN